MAILRRKAKRSDPDDVAGHDEVTPIAEPPAGVRTEGPWDASERDTSDDDAYVDLGSLRVRGREGTEIRLQSDGPEDRIGAALILAGESALEVRAFAGPRSPGQWDVVRADLLAEVGRLDGECEQVDGPFGPELRVRIPVKLDDGQEGVQPSRIIGIDGPRWMLRATLLGRAALEPSDEGTLVDTLRDIVVVRGAEAMAAREPLLLTPPDGAVAPGAE